MHDYQKCMGILKYGKPITKYSAFFVLFVLLIIVNSINAQAYVALKHNNIQLNEDDLWRQTQLLDSNPSFLALTQSYHTAKKVTSTFGGTGAYVTQVNLTNTTDQMSTWYVNIHAVYLDVGTAYWQPDHGELVTLESFGQRTSENPKLAHSQVFSLPLKPQESGTLWIYIQAKMFATPVLIEFDNKTEFYEKQFLINSITSISYTVMLTLALIALFIYLRTKYLVTLACTGYIGIQGLGWFTASGSAGHLVSVSAFNLVYSGIIIFPFAIASACQFTKLLFNCQLEHPKLAKTFNMLSLACLSLGVIMPFIPFSQSFLISHIIAALWIPLCIGTGIFMLAKKDFRAKYYLTGNLLYGLSLAGYILSHLYKVDWDIPLEVIVQILSLIHI